MKLSITEVSYLLADRLPLDEVAEKSGWSKESLRTLISKGLHKEEIDYETELRSLDDRISERFEKEQEHVYGERHFTSDDDHDIYAGLYTREEGDPEELNFNDY